MTEFEKTLEKMKTILGVANDSEVADAIGMKPSAFANRKKSESVPFSHYLKIIKSHNVNLNWFIYNDGPMYKNTESEPTSQGTISKNEHIIVADHCDPEKKIYKDENGVNIPQWDNPNPDIFHYVPMAKANLNAGGGSFVLSENTTGRYYAFRKHFLAAIASSPKNLILMKVTGDSMEPKIEDGDTVMIDIGKRQLKNGAIYALGYDDIIVIKELEKLPGGRALVISKNRKMYPPYEADIRQIRIIGQVIWGDRTFIK